MFGKPNRRWIDCNSHLWSECGTTITNMSCLPGEPRELLVGDLDMDWSDKSEVTLARIVGNINVFLASSIASLTAIPLPALVRFGLLVTEDTDRLYQAIDLGDPESLEEYEWMWLTEQIMPFQLDYLVAEERTAAGSLNLTLDTSVKRKLGKKDSLVLYSQIATMLPEPTGFTLSGRYTYQLRCVMT